jgi:hypothetical protein
MSVNFVNVVCVFAGDFGGYFGLFLGGSLLSFFEILDLVAYNALIKLTTRSQKRINPQIIHVKSVDTKDSLA